MRDLAKSIVVRRLPVVLTTMDIPVYWAFSNTSEERSRLLLISGAILTKLVLILLEYRLELLKQQNELKRRD